MSVPNPLIVWILSIVYINIMCFNSKFFQLCLSKALLSEYRRMSLDVMLVSHFFSRTILLVFSVSWLFNKCFVCIPSHEVHLKSDHTQSRYIHKFCGTNALAKLEAGHHCILKVLYQALYLLFYFVSIHTIILYQGHQFMVKLCG